MTSMPTPALDQHRPWLVLVLRLVAVACLVPIPIFGLVMYFVGGADERPDPLALVVVVALVVTAFALAQAIGYRAPAIRPGTPPARALAAGRTAVILATLLRLAITWSPVIGALVVAFLFPAPVWTFALGAVLTIPSVLWHVWPRAAGIRALERRLDRAGERSGLSTALGLQPGSAPLGSVA